MRQKHFDCYVTTCFFLTKQMNYSANLQSTFAYMFSYKQTRLHMDCVWCRTANEFQEFMQVRPIVTFIYFEIDV